MWRICRDNGWWSVFGKKRGRKGKPGAPAHDDLVRRDFTADTPNRLWLTDITEHPTREGKVYCAVVLDACSRRVVGWSISHNPTAGLTCNALGMAIEQRDAIRGTVIHSDHGTQFTAWTFSERARKSGLLPSMGSVGDCYDNAMIEAFWSRMQVELLNAAGRPGSNSRTRSSSTSRSSTTAAGATRVSAC